MKRIEKLRSLQLCDAYLIISDINRFYLSGYRSSFGYLLITAKENVYFVTDFRYYEEAQVTFADKDIYVIGVTGSDAPAKLAEILLSEGVKSIGFEANRITHFDYMSLNEFLSAKMDSISFTDIGKQLDNLRIIKDDAEIENITKAQQIADKAFSKILAFIKPGLTEREVYNELNHQMLLLGAGDTAFSSIVASGINSSRPHSGVSDKKINTGEFITLDFGAKVSGYCSDMTRTVAIGKVTDEMQSVYNAVLKSQQVAINAYKEHVSCKEAYTIAKTCLKTYGYDEFFKHGLGHGVGLEIHESPGINSISEERLLPGMVVTAEPGVYLENKFGVRIEDLIVIKENGIKNLTSSDAKLIIL